MVNMATIAADHYKYYSAMRAKFEVRDLTDNALLYSYNPFTATGKQGQPLMLSVSRSINHAGAVRIVFQDSDLVIDKEQVRTPARVKVWLSKENANWVGYFQGFVRGQTKRMGMNDATFYELTTPGLGQRANERILDFDRTTPDTLEDGITLDVNDIQQQADEMIKDSLNDPNEYPQDIRTDRTEGGNGYNFMNHTKVKLAGLNDYIHSIVARYVTMRDFWNFIEGFTGGRVYVDFDGFARFTPLPTPVNQSTGFVLKRLADPTLDQSDSTCQLVEGSFRQFDSFVIDSGYANRMIGILPADPEPDPDNPPSSSNKTSNLSFEIAMKVRVPTNPNWDLWVGVQLNDGSGADNHVPRSRWRFCRDDGNKPMDVGGIIDSFYAYEEGYNLTRGGLQWLRAGNGKDKGVDIDSEEDVWLILSSVNASSTNGYWEWYHDNSGIQGFSATASPNTSDATDGGSGWNVSLSGPSYIYQLLRHKDQAQTISFDQGIGYRSMIEQTIGTFPNQVNTVRGGLKYLLSIGRLRSGPQRTYDNVIIRAPNKPIFEGDLFQIENPKYGISQPGRRAEFGNCADVNYTFGSEKGTPDLFTLGTKFMTLTIKTYPQGY